MIPNTKENREQYLKRATDKVKLKFKGNDQFSIEVPARNVDWVDDQLEGFVLLPNELDVTAEEEEAWEMAERRMDIIGQNGPTGEHYEQSNKYQREIKPGVFVDVYDVLKAFKVECPALQHLIKKALACGQRGHKDKLEDLDDIVISAKRARELGR